MKIIFSEKCLEYGKQHIEGPERVKTAAEILKNKGYEFLDPEPASQKELLLAHKKDYLESVKRGSIEDQDTPAHQNIYLYRNFYNSDTAEGGRGNWVFPRVGKQRASKACERQKPRVSGEHSSRAKLVTMFEYASLSAGGAILAARVGGFSLMRPPGHHAGIAGSALGASTRGFCYFNNIAVAVKHLAKPTLILDIDGHHGNGTEEIFSGQNNITFVSLHRYPEYPGTGLRSKENCHNFPLPPDCGNNIYLKTLEKAFKQVDFSKIEAVAVSAGFDCHKGGLASLGLTEKAFAEIGKRIADLKKHTFFILEGGYDGQILGQDIDSLLKGIAN